MLKLGAGVCLGILLVIVDRVLGVDRVGRLGSRVRVLGNINKVMGFSLVWACDLFGLILLRIRL